MTESNIPLAPVVILAGGLSHERDVSIRSGRRVATALRRVGHQVTEADLTADLVPLVTSGDTKPVVFPMLHGATGEDGALREVLGLLGVGFIGSSGHACRVTFDKSIAGTVVARAGMNVPEQVALPHDIFRELGARPLVAALGERLGFPLMVKPARSGSALGATKVESADALPQALVAAFAYDPTAVVERYIEGTEVAITVIVEGDDRQVLPPVQIQPESGIYDYAARYTAGTTRFIVPAKIDEDARQRSESLSLAVVERLGLTGIVRVDLIIDADGQPWFLEANVAPGMTETSLVPLAMQAAGLDLGEVCSRLVQTAVSRTGK